MATLLHLNGASGVGKTTIARAVAAARPGMLVLDVDELRTWVSGWESDFVGTGERVRSSALALISAYLGTGHDVVLPQLVVTPSELDRFRQAAISIGADYVGVVLTVDDETLLGRLRSRERTPLVEVVDAIIAERGGEELVLRGARDLSALAAAGELTVVDTTDRAAAVEALVELLSATSA